MMGKMIQIEAKRAFTTFSKSLKSVVTKNFPHSFNPLSPFSSTDLPQTSICPWQLLASESLVTSAEAESLWFVTETGTYSAWISPGIHIKVQIIFLFSASYCSQ